VVKALAHGAREGGHEVAVAAAAGPLEADLEAEIFPLPHIGRRVVRIPRAVLALRAAVRRFEPHLVHAHNPGIGLVASLATIRGGKPRALVSVHGVPDEDYPAAARTLRLANLPVVACGPGVAAALAEHGVPVRRTIVNGIGPAPAPCDRGTLAAEWNRPNAERLVVAVGRLVEQKNHALAIRALADLPGIALAIVGEGPLRAELERVADETGVGDRVVLAGARPDARGVIAAADAVVLPSRWEGLPLVALETLASGTPLVATAVRGTRELVRDGVNGVLVTPDEPRALADGLRRVLSDAKLADRLACGGLQLAATHSRERMVERYLELYRELVK
jgi:glycosyltransferase involved in cell wall biosynthesis